MNLVVHTWYTQITTMSSLLSLRQAVTPPTHFSHSDTLSTIDLIFILSAFKTHALMQVSIIPPIGSSDHQSILSCISLPSLSPYSTPSKVSPHKSYLYHLAGFESINKNLDKIDWQSILPPNVNEAWSIFSSLFCTTVQQFTPSKIATPHQYPPWFPRSLFHKMDQLHVRPEEFK